MAKELLGERQVAEILNVSVHTLSNDRFLCRGIPYVKLRKTTRGRGAIRYRAADVYDFIEKNRIVPDERRKNE